MDVQRLTDHANLTSASRYLKTTRQGMHARSDEDARGTTGTSADNAAMEVVHSQILSDIPSFLDGAVAKR
jgi:hypothetical protein